MGRGQQPTPHQLEGLGSAVSSSSGARAEPRPPKGFTIFSTHDMASPETIIFLIVDSHAAIGGKTPVPLAYAVGENLHDLPRPRSTTLRAERSQKNRTSFMPIPFDVRFKICGVTDREGQVSSVSRRGWGPMQSNFRSP